MASDPDMADSVQVGAIVFAQTKSTFSAREFAAFLRMGGVTMDEEAANDCLSDLVDRQQLRQIGPGVYAAPVSG